MDAVHELEFSTEYISKQVRFRELVEGTNMCSSGSDHGPISHRCLEALNFAGHARCAVVDSSGKVSSP